MISLIAPQQHEVKPFPHRVTFVEQNKKKMSSVKRSCMVLIITRSVLNLQFMSLAPL